MIRWIIVHYCGRLTLTSHLSLRNVFFDLNVIIFFSHIHHDKTNLGSGNSPARAQIDISKLGMTGVSCAAYRQRCAVNGKVNQLATSSRLIRRFISCFLIGFITFINSETNNSDFYSNGISKFYKSFNKY